MTLTIPHLVGEAYRNSQAHGFWEDHPDWESPQYRAYLASKIALIHSEASEALEEIRKDHPVTLQFVTETGKPEGLPSELADIVIRVADLCGHLGINLEEALEEKLAFNATRPRLHGGKLL